MTTFSRNRESASLHGANTAAPVDRVQALDVLVASGPSLSERYALPWSAEDVELTAALRFLLHTGPAAADSQRNLAIVGIVGGASSGKSTLFNNLLGGRHASQVTMMSHTTKGPILAAHVDHEEMVLRWRDGDQWLLPGLKSRQAGPDDRDTGRPDAATIVPAGADLLENHILIDTPDFTSQASLLEGDRARNMLPWFDKVLVVVDEDRWFDRQTFGWLRDRLDRLQTPRMVIFNRNERSSPLTELDRERLIGQAAKLRADHVLIEHVPGRGLREYPAEAVATIRNWLGVATDAGVHSGRERRLAYLLAERANACLNANERHREDAEALSRALDDTLRGEIKSNTRIAYDVLLSESEARVLSPYWQGIVRPGSWLKAKTTSFLQRMPGASLLTSRKLEDGRTGAAHAEDMVSRGESFFSAEVSRIADHLAICATRNALFADNEASQRTLLTLRPAADETSLRGREEALKCRDALEHFVQVLDKSAADLNVSLAASGGVVAGALLGALLTAPAGGWGMPAGALVGAAIGGPATGLSARSMLRLYKTMMGTPELKALWNSVKDYRSAIESELEGIRENVMQVARSRVLATEEPLHGALCLIRDAGDRT